MKIGIVGYGHLGHSLGSGLMMSGSAESGELCVCEPAGSPGAAAAAAEGIRVSADINDVIGASEVIFLTVKAAVFAEIAKTVDRAALDGKTIVSFMAGVPLAKLHEQIGDAEIVWAMPSIAIASCDGVIGYTDAPDKVVAIFERLGYAFRADEADIGKVMAFSSCGLGFAALLLDAFCSVGTYFGFSPEVSRQITEQTFKNAIALGDFRDTAAAVATPGGATEQGVNHINAADVHGIMQQAAQKAFDKMK